MEEIRQKVKEIFAKYDLAIAKEAAGYVRSEPLGRRLGEIDTCKIMMDLIMCGAEYEKHYIPCNGGQSKRKRPLMDVTIVARFKEENNV